MSQTAPNILAGIEGMEDLPEVKATPAKVETNPQPEGVPAIVKTSAPTQAEAKAAQSVEKSLTSAAQSIAKAEGSAIAGLLTTTGTVISNVRAAIGRMDVQSMEDAYQGIDHLGKQGWTTKAALASGMRTALLSTATEEKKAARNEGETIKPELLVRAKMSEVADRLGIAPSTLYTESKVWEQILGKDYDKDTVKVSDPWTGIVVDNATIANCIANFEKRVFTEAVTRFGENSKHTKLHPAAVLGVLLDMKLSTAPRMTTREAERYMVAIKAEVDPRDAAKLAEFEGNPTGADEKTGEKAPTSPKEGAKTQDTGKNLKDLLSDFNGRGAGDIADLIQGLQLATLSLLTNEALACEAFVYIQADNRWGFSTDLPTPDAGDTVTVITLKKEEGKITGTFENITGKIELSETEGKLADMTDPFGDEG